MILSISERILACFGHGNRRASSIDFRRYLATAKYLLQSIARPHPTLPLMGSGWRLRLPQRRSPSASGSPSKHKEAPPANAGRGLQRLRVSLPPEGLFSFLMFTFVVTIVVTQLRLFGNNFSFVVNEMIFVNS